jgi:hypothetical protein
VNNAAKIENDLNKSTSFDLGPPGAVTKEFGVSAKVENPAGAKKAVDEFLTKNPAFANSHKYTGNYKVSGDGKILAASFMNTR